MLVSKSGTTQETLTNEAFALKWLADAGVDSPRKQVIAVTSETSPLAKSSEYLDSFFIDDFIGGRYSSSSAVGGAILSLAYGPDVFAEILAGAHAADRAALEPTVNRNAAMLDALIGVYERNVLGYRATAVLPYSQALIRFPAHLQQLDMESNGKRVNRDGQPLDYSTGPISSASRGRTASTASTSCSTRAPTSSRSSSSASATRSTEPTSSSKAPRASRNSSRTSSRRSSPSRSARTTRTRTSTSPANGRAASCGRTDSHRGPSAPSSRTSRTR